MPSIVPLNIIGKKNIKRVLYVSQFPNWKPRSRDGTSPKSILPRYVDGYKATAQGLVFNNRLVQIHDMCIVRFEVDILSQ